MVEVPDHAIRYLDRDVAAWLHRVAQDRYGGDVERAMNVMLRVVMTVHEGPDDPWAAIRYEAATIADRR